MIQAVGLTRGRSWITYREAFIEFAAARYTGRQLAADQVIDQCGGDEKYVERDDRGPQERDLPGNGERYKTESEQNVKEA